MKSELVLVFVDDITLAYDAENGAARLLAFGGSCIPYQFQHQQRED